MRHAAAYVSGGSRFSAARTAAHATSAATAHAPASGAAGAGARNREEAGGRPGSRHKTARGAAAAARGERARRRALVSARRTLAGPALVACAARVRETIPGDMSADALDAFVCDFAWRAVLRGIDPVRIMHECL